MTQNRLTLFFCGKLVPISLSSHRRQVTAVTTTVALLALSLRQLSLLISGKGTRGLPIPMRDLIHPTFTTDGDTVLNDEKSQIKLLVS